MRRVISVVLPLLIALTIRHIGLAQEPDHASRWEFAERFIRDVWLHPIRALKVNLLGAGPVHNELNDC